MEGATVVLLVQQTDNSVGEIKQASSFSALLSPALGDQLCFPLQVESALGFYPMELGQTVSLATGERGASPATGCKMWAGGCSLRPGVLCRLASR